MINTPFVFRGTESGTTRQTELPAKLCGIDQVVWMTARRDTVSGSTDSQAPCLACVTDWSDQSKYMNDATLRNSAEAVNDIEYWPDYWTGDTTSNYLPFISFDRKTNGPDSANFLNIPYDSSFSELTTLSFSTIFRTRRINPNITTEPDDNSNAEVVLFQNGNSTSAASSRSDGWGIDYAPGSNSLRVWYYDTGISSICDPPVANSLIFTINDMTEWLRLTVRISGNTIEGNLYNLGEFASNSGMTWGYGCNNGSGTGIKYGVLWPSNPNWFIASQKGPDFPGIGNDTTILEGSWDIAEYILYNQYLPDSCINTIWNYYDYRYGITNVQSVPTYFNITVGDTGSTSSTNLAPVNLEEDYSWHGMIYLQSEINKSGTIENISFDISSFDGGGTPNVTLENVRIYIGHTTQSSFPVISPPEDLGGTYATDWTLVYDDTLVFNSTTGWSEINLQTGFEYNNTNNLLIKFENRDGSQSTLYEPFFRHTLTTNTICYNSDFLSYPTSGGVRGSVRPNIRINLLGTT
jgi:hypothetical protein